MGVETNERKRRVSLLKVPIDIIAPKDLGLFVYDLIKDEKEHNIVLLSLWDLLRARRRKEYRNYVMNASLVIPISKSIISGLRFLSGESAYRYMPFDFIVSILTSLEKREYSCYLLGGKPKILLKTEKNIRHTFPKLRIVGRFFGSFKRNEEPTIIQAIKKASPSLLLVGNGIRGSEYWITRNKDSLGKGMRLWCSDIFDVFAEKKKHPSRAAFEKGLDWVGTCFQKPYKFFRLFSYIYYKLLLVIYKISGKE
ncbi:MAG: WecB/TagA/CpsF family glycosyltransferase [Treponema sp.]|nr:WecB/TagA/CpsF family glycosyltransferase [Treponema sp.]